MFLFENLKVYQKALDFADEIHNISQAFPKGSWYFVDQLNRASVSISVNIAEGNVTHPPKVGPLFVIE